jgi:hypothetical protein
MKNYENVAAREIIEQEEAKLQEEVRKVDVERIEKQLELTEKRLNPVTLVPGLLLSLSQEGQSASNGLVASGEAPEAALTQRLGRQVLVVPAGGEILSLFEARTWASVDPASFPYGDGVYGVQREAKLLFHEWLQYFMDRVELEYESPSEEDVLAKSLQEPVLEQAEVPKEVGQSLQPPASSDVSRASPSGEVSQDVEAVVQNAAENFDALYSEGGQKDGVVEEKVVLEEVLRAEGAGMPEPQYPPVSFRPGEYLKQMERLKQSVKENARKARQLEEKAKRNVPEEPVEVSGVARSRWRGTRDLWTLGYSIGQRKAYINSARLFFFLMETQLQIGL